MSLVKRTVRGMMWAYSIYIGGRLLSMLSTAILARILVPADFGLIGYAVLLLNFIEATRDFGIKDALIYTSDRVEDTADSAFVMNIGIGLLQYAVAFLLAPLAINFIDDPRIVLMIRLMSLTFIFNALGNTHDALLQKELEFRRRYMPEFISTLLKGIVSVVLAALGFGVWSLVAGHIFGALFRTVGLWFFLGWMPRFRFFWDRARLLWDYGVHILLFSMLAIALEQADQLIIGTLLGEVQLGYYTIAARIPEMIIANFSLVLTRVLFPSYAKVKDDLQKLTRGFLATTQYTAFVTMAMGMGLFAVADELVFVVFGDQWGPAVVLLRVLALLGMVGTLPWSAGDVFKALGRPDVSTKLLAVEALYTFPLIWVMTVGSRVAVMASLANLIAMSIATVVRLWLVSRFLKINPLMFVRIFRSPLISGVAMVVVVTGWRMLVASWSPLAVLLTAIPIGGAVYTGLMWLMERDEIMEVWYTLRGALRRDTQEMPVVEQPAEG